MSAGEVREVEGGEHAAVDGQHDLVDVRRLVARQEHGRGGDVLAGAGTPDRDGAGEVVEPLDPTVWTLMSVTLTLKGWTVKSNICIFGE